MTLNSLIAANPQIKNPNLIYPGNEVELPGSFGAFPGDRVTLHLEKLGLTGLYRVAEAENRFSAREGAVMIWTLKECE